MKPRLRIGDIVVTRKGVRTIGGWSGYGVIVESDWVETGSEDCTVTIEPLDPPVFTEDPFHRRKTFCAYQLGKARRAVVPVHARPSQEIE